MKTLSLIILLALPGICLLSTCRKKDAQQTGNISTFNGCSAVMTSDTAITCSTFINGFSTTPEEMGFCWDTSPEPTIEKNRITRPIGFGQMSVVLTGLKTDVTYYVRAYLTSSVGTVYSQQASIFYSYKWKTIPTPYWVSAKCIALQDSTIFLGTTGHGMHITKNNGVTWMGSAAGEILSICTAGSLQLVGRQDGLLYSPNGGTFWNFHSSNITGVSSLKALSENNVLAGSMHGPWLFIRNGTEWNRVGTPGPDLVITCLDFFGSTCVAGAANGQVMKSDDGGLNWTLLPNQFVSVQVTSILISGSRVFAGTLNQGLFVSQDGGQTWVRNEFLSTSTWTSLAKYGNSIIAGTFSGVYRSDNNGESWQSLNAGMPDLVIRAVAVHDNHVYATTNLGLLCKRKLEK